MELLVYHNPEAMERGINPFDHGSLHTDMWKTEGLKQALDKYGFDAAFGGARRDEEKSRAKERIFSLPHRQSSLGPEEPAARAVEPLQRAQGEGREHPRVPDLATGPSSTSGSTSMLEDIEIVPLYFAAPRPTVERDGLLLMVDDERFPLQPGEAPVDALDPLPHARLLPADRRGRERGGDAARSDPGNAADHHLASARAARSTTTRRREHGEEEAGGLFLMADPPNAVYKTDALIAEDIEAYLEQHQHKSAAALHHLRLASTTASRR